MEKSRHRRHIQYIADHALFSVVGTTGKKNETEGREVAIISMFGEPIATTTTKA
jgi:hypothetical protein